MLHPSARPTRRLRRLLSAWLLTCTLTSSANATDDALDYLNALRGSAGLNPLASDPSLTMAAQRHAEYQVLNQVGGHYEQPGSPGFTGETPAERAVAAGYRSRWMTENISLGSPTAIESIDGLLAAIYHRFSLLANDIDEIGVGNSDTVYTYDLGNSGRDALCGGDDFDQPGRYYVDVCSDASLRVEATAYEATRTDLALTNPLVTRWPPPDARDIPPAFFDETPDPLPDHDVSGYPVSLAFNPARMPGAVVVERFDLFGPSGQPLAAATRILAPDDDIHGQFTDRQFAFLPQARLDWGTRYRVEADYRVDGGELQRLDWQFTTRPLPHPFYVANGTGASDFDVVSDRDYSIYVPPLDQNDRFSGYSLTYVASQRPTIDFVDGNTLNVSLVGEPGHYARLYLDNGREITLTIAAGDSAQDNTRVAGPNDPAAWLIELLAPLLLD